MKKLEKDNALRLRRQGKSISFIANKIGVSKASVSIWVRNIELSARQKEKLSLNGRSVESIERRRINRLRNEQIKRQIIIDEAKKDIGAVSNTELKIIGAMLYWAEGLKRGKRVVGFSNSDPQIIKIMMNFFREVCGVPESKFRGHIHTYSHLNANEAEGYWSSITGISLQQFYKTYSKRSKSSQGKMDSLPYGTCDIYVCDTQLFLTILGWIEGIAERISLNDAQR